MKRPPSLIGDPGRGEMAHLAGETPPGAFVEVGVYKGGSAWELAQVAEQQGREVHLFDTFCGMPWAEDFDNHKVGEFGDTDADAVIAAIPYAKVHVGTFPDTLPADLTQIAFVHVDCDQYQSIRAVIDELGPRMVPGGGMLFDDWKCTKGADRAIKEAFPEERIETTKCNKAYVRFP